MPQDMRKQPEQSYVRRHKRLLNSTYHLNAIGTHYRSPEVVFRESPEVAKSVSSYCIVLLRSDSMLVKVKAVALNPEDGKLLDREPNTDECVLGVNYAGVAENATNGETIKEQKKGDRVANPVHSSKCASRSPRI